MSVLNLTTRFGDLDLTFAPSGFVDGFDALRVGATAMTIDGVRVLVANLDDVIASKEAAGRDKDFEALPRIIRLVQRIIGEIRDNEMCWCAIYYALRSGLVDIISINRAMLLSCNVFHS